MPPTSTNSNSRDSQAKKRRANSYKLEEVVNRLNNINLAVTRVPGLSSHATRSAFCRKIFASLYSIVANHIRFRKVSLGNFLVNSQFILSRILIVFFKLFSLFSTSLAFQFNHEHITTSHIYSYKINVVIDC